MILSKKSRKILQLIIDCISYVIAFTITTSLHISNGKLFSIDTLIFILIGFTIEGIVTETIEYLLKGSAEN